ncbi:MAG TPA: hypothetical protein VIU61_17805 [Kofleriaceae bacterium]
MVRGYPEVGGACYFVAMRLLGLVGLALVACSQSSQSGPHPTPSQQRIARHVPDIVTTVTQYFVPDPTVMMLAALGAGEVPCWKALVAKVKGSYAFQDTAHELSVIILEGDLPRAEIEACAPIALTGQFATTVERDGEHAVFVVGELGKVYGSWRDGLLVMSTKEGIAAVESGARSTEPWAQRLAKLPRGQLITASTDPSAGKVLALPSKGYDIVVEDTLLGRGRVYLRMGSAADAAAAAKQIKENKIEWPGTPPTGLGDIVSTLPVTVRGDTVEIEFDSQRLGALDGPQVDAYAKLVRTRLKTP